MSETARLWMETTFSIFYLICVWWLVIAMFLRRGRVEENSRAAAALFLWAFVFLGIGDLGHVGFKLVALALGGPGTSVDIFGGQLRIAAMGSLATAITFTFFYIIMIMLWRQRFKKSYGWFCYLLFASAAIRFLLMTHPSNGWNSLEAQQPWSIYRNIPLMIMQVGAAYLMLRDGVSHNDRTFIRIGALILASFACYAPVVFLLNRLPLIGMLMIPKTIAYLVIACIGFLKFYKKRPLQAASAAGT